MQYMDKCPNCGARSDDFTVMNDMNKNLQVPSLAKRMGVEEHGLIVCCDIVTSHDTEKGCQVYFEVDTGTVLTLDERAECNQIWEESQKGS